MAQLMPLGNSFFSLAKSLLALILLHFWELKEAAEDKDESSLKRKCQKRGSRKGIRVFRPGLKNKGT